MAGGSDSDGSGAGGASAAAPAGASDRRAPSERAPRRRRGAPPPAGRCFKCGTGAAAVASRDGPRRPYCLQCFVEFVDGSFRDAFFRHCGVPPGRPLLLAVSGGPSSMAMLRMAARLRDAAAAAARRRGEGGGPPSAAPYDLTVLHLDETGVVCAAPDAAAPRDDESRQAAAAAAAVRAESARLGVPCRVLPLAALVDAAVVPALRRRRAALSDREDVVDLARRAALLNAACALGGFGLLLGDSALTAAWRALSEIARGRGGGVVATTGYCARVAAGPRRELLLYRPMRGVLAAEAALYCRAQSLPAVWQVAPTTLSGQRSLNRCLEGFVAGLALDYRSTVFSILNTVTKLSPTPRPPGPAECRAAGAGRLHAHEAVLRALRRDAEGRDAPLCSLCRMPRPRRRPDLGGGAGVADGCRQCYGCAVLLHTLGEELSRVAVGADEIEALGGAE